MKPTLAFGLVLAALVSGGIVSFADENTGENAKSKQPEKLTVTTYRTADLPVFTSDKEWSPVLLMDLIQSTVFPKSWEAKGGTSTMAPYPQNQSIVISTNSRNHKRIQKLIERLRD
ncbi:hypothetical protein CA13_00950 [Planctomycetes bacterium CA13]|uniref:Uncharacterized protein n=2 Tax=Novipirellula herctigrandis TaxID=2527986 RepID=A0A5C5YUJ1_9BACT|nr:hypothetical protein CA13_00950 [Planctomycetes bacterium CA13]